MGLETLAYDASHYQRHTHSCPSTDHNKDQTCTGDCSTPTRSSLVTICSPDSARKETVAKTQFPNAVAGFVSSPYLPDGHIKIEQAKSVSTPVPLNSESRASSEHQPSRFDVPAAVPGAHLS